MMCDVSPSRPSSQKSSLQQIKDMILTLKNLSSVEESLFICMVWICLATDGVIPSKLGELSKLRAMNLSRNFLLSSIPDSFSKLCFVLLLTQASYLHTGGNSLICFQWIPKRWIFGSKDLISSLPDAFICHILFLSIKDVALTSILTKRWRCLLAFVTISILRTPSTSLLKWVDRKGFICVKALSFCG